ncbi:hypothetical protein DL93DRAFT_2077232 [Clavulina sp. PMI_390]|nr:hypothetical protein DL93DRAFT_2077232 [Clavulina sp. PMI_390]
MTDYSNRALTASIMEDHNELREYHEKYLAAKSDYEERAKWANLFRWELARHTVAEEIIWYPALEKALGEEGVKAADHDRAEHQQSKEDLQALENLQVTDAEFARLFAKIYKDLEHHLKDEEEKDLPKFEAAISEEESKKLSEQFETTKKWMPTRMHPSLPNKPPFATVTALLTTPIDKVKDMFTTFPTSNA